MALNITDGERVMLGRRREGRSQEALANDLDLSQSLVSRWEAGKKPVPKRIRKRYNALGRLTRGEQCLIMRRRLSISIRDAAQQFGISHFHLIRIEADERQSDAYFRFIKQLYEDTTNEANTRTD